jgi:hypothetical protein
VAFTAVPIATRFVGRAAPQTTVDSPRPSPIRSAAVVGVWAFAPAGASAATVAKPATATTAMR